MFPDVWGAITWFVTLPGVQAIVLIVTSIATAGSVIVALRISWRARQLQETRDSIEAAARLERRAERQAVLIRVELSGHTPEGDGTHTDGVAVFNLSELPIREVTGAVFVGHPKPSGTDYQGTWSIEDPRIVFGARDTLFSINFASELNDNDWRYGEIGFVDAYGDAWRVDSRGILTLTHEKFIYRQIESA